jgi:hypothetical protein
VYTTYEQFRTDILVLWAAVLSDRSASYDMKTPEEECLRAWNLFENAKANDLAMLILGQAGLRTDMDLLRNMGTTATSSMVKESDLTSSTTEGPVSSSSHAGSVLTESNWWPLANDAWVLGGVQGLHSFHLAMGAMPAEEALWDPGRNRMRMLGRELAGLRAFGYRRVSNQFESTLGVVFAPGDTNRALAANFAQYYAALAETRSAAAILKSFE